VFAVLVAMSRVPSDVLARVALDAILERAPVSINFEGIFDRLGLELPKLESSSKLGLVLLALLEIPNERFIGMSGRKAIHDFITRFELKAALSMALEHYLVEREPNPENQAKYSLRLNNEREAMLGYAMRIRIEATLVEEIHHARPFTFGRSVA
jgi:hypothetical protein